MSEILTKAYDGLEVTKADDGYSEVAGVFSSSRRDREGDVVMQDFNLKEFRKNPVLLFNHSTMHPIGKVVKTELGDKKSNYKAVLSQTSFAQEVAKLMDEGIVRHSSHRFKPGKAEQSEKEGEGFTFSENTLVEISVVPIPANLDAVVEARGAEFPAVCKALADDCKVLPNDATAPHMQQSVDDEPPIVDDNATTVANTDNTSSEEQEAKLPTKESIRRYASKVGNAVVQRLLDTLNKLTPGGDK